eukprot:GHUV01038966.1.p1 GENE.GHUV01038966.1~~GHUV01038966.1.p1  ORF type:complete len:126 (+),score=35.70 GHUV01038966.1:886-1263(+)
MHQHLLQLLKGCDALGLIKHVNPPESIQLLSTAVHVGATPSMLMQLMDGSLGLPLFGQSEKALTDKVATAADSAASGSAKQLGTRPSSISSSVWCYCSWQGSHHHEQQLPRSPAAIPAVCCCSGR